MKPEFVTEWLRKYHFGEPGSKQNLAHMFGSALVGGLVLKRAPDAHNEQQREQMQRDYESWTKILLCAIGERNSAFFRDLADGLDALKENALSFSSEPRRFLADGYMHCSEKGTRVPTKSEVIAMAKRLWAVARLTHCATARPDIQYDQKSEEKIAAEIKRLPDQKWCRHFKSLGLSSLPSAKPGPK
jgi:hypothetical protein